MKKPFNLYLEEETIKKIKRISEGMKITPSNFIEDFMKNWRNRMFYEIRIEPKKNISKDEIKTRIEKSFADIGLSSEGVEIINID